jgi:glycosyltransferase involved in cell wall biosynthesis
MSELRVCFVVDSGTDVRLVEGLAERLNLLVLARRMAPAREVSQPPTRPLRMEVGPAGRIRFGWFAVRRLLAIRRAVDLVLVQGYGSTAACVNAVARFARVPVLMLVCSPAEAYYRCRKRRDSPRRFRTVEYYAIKLFSALNARLGQGYVALSPYLATVIRGHGTNRPIDVIPVYGVDRDVFHPACEPKSAVRARLGLADDLPIVFFSSRVAPEKDAATVLRAVGVLASSGRPVRLLHLSGGYRQFVELASRLGVRDHVVAADAVPPDSRLADYYRACDVCVQASREEGLGFSVLEALACGVPVVATAVGGLNDTIREGETGWQVSAGDADALAVAIRQILANPAEAARRTVCGRQGVELRYDRRLVFDTFVHRLAGAVSR